MGMDDQNSQNKSETVSRIIKDTLRIEEHEVTLPLMINRLNSNFPRTSRDEHPIFSFIEECLKEQDHDN